MNTSEQDKKWMAYQMISISSHTKKHLTKNTSWKIHRMIDDSYPYSLTSAWNFQQPLGPKRHISGITRHLLFGERVQAVLRSQQSEGTLCSRDPTESCINVQIYTRIVAAMTHDHPKHSQVRGQL